MNNDIIFLIIKIFSINVGIDILFLKFNNNKKIDVTKIIEIITIAIFEISVYYVFDGHVDQALLVFLNYIIQCIFISFFIEKDSMVVLIVALATALTYIAYTIASIIEGIIKNIMYNKNIVVDGIFIATIQFLIILHIIRIKKLKNGLSFAKNKMKDSYIDIIITTVAIMVIVAYTLFGKYYGNLMTDLVIVFIIISIVMVAMIQKTLTLYYKQKLLAQTIQDYQNTIKSKDQEIQKLSDEKYNISKINHEFYNRQKALEKKISDFVNENNMKTEASNELSIIDSIRNLSGEYSNKMKSIKKLETLPRTNIEEIDDMFTYMQSECVKNNIDFKLKIEGDIYHLTNTIIDKSSLATLIGDHLRDAIIALNFSKNSNRSIFTILGTTDKYYEFRVYDSGIEFEINTLLELGTKPITTHTESGGSGIGFMTTFETLKKTGASIIIDEIGKESVSNYTKAVKIRFDKMNQYIINSYRQNEFSQKSNRIIINKILEENMIDLHMHTNYSDGTDTCEESLKNVD